MKVTNQNAILEVIGRLQGRANHHKNAGNQTTNQGKAEAHQLASSDMLDLANTLANAFDEPEKAILQKTHEEAIIKQKKIDKKVSKAQATTYNTLQLMDGEIIGDYITKQWRMQWKEGGLTPTNSIRQSIVEALLQAKLIHLTRDEKGLFIYKATK